MSRCVLVIAVLAVLSVPARALVIEAPRAAIKTEGGPGPGGSWNLWSNGRVGQPLRFGAQGRYAIAVRAWGSSAGGVWPEMALLLDEEAVEVVTVDRDLAADYSFEVVVPAGVHELAVGFLNDAVIGEEDRNLFVRSITVRPLAGAAEPSLASAAERTDRIREEERRVLDEAGRAIEKNRKTDAVLRVVSAAGTPISGARVGVEQVAHEFLFGCNILMFGRFDDEERNEVYKSRFAELFNYATTGFYWRWYEPEQGRPRYAETDEIVAWCADHGIRMKGHPLLWGHEAGIPPWSKGQPAPDVQRRRVEAILDRFSGRIEFWEVVNEPSHLPEPRIDDPYRWARAADPGAYLIVNDYLVLGDGAPDFYALLEKAAADGIPFDGIGIQAHEPRAMRFPLARVRRTLDRYAGLGKELHITEFTPPSAGQEMAGSYAGGKWNEAAQAEYAADFYTVCFAHPAVRAITWWDLCDRGAWLEGGGMLRADLSPKPVYERLEKLIHEEWKTRAAGETGADGTFAFRGFRGTYRIDVEVGGKKVTKEIALQSAEAVEFVVSMP
ncbi:MAG: endo-1,4-beta-xylanase [Planctomycetes bacterium]|nr:endo-1,4-beta-xylanase [Planctomycetota bacterium]